MEDHKYDLKSGTVFLGVEAGGNAASVILYGYGAVVVEGNADGVAASRHRFVDGVIDDLVYEVMESSHTRGTDVHTGALTDGVQTFEDLYLIILVQGIFGDRIAEEFVVVHGESFL
jgi:hypothetical protein